MIITIYGVDYAFMNILEHGGLLHGWFGCPLGATSDSRHQQAAGSLTGHPGEAETMGEIPPFLQTSGKRFKNYYVLRKSVPRHTIILHLVPGSQLFRAASTLWLERNLLTMATLSTSVSMVVVALTPQWMTVEAQCHARILQRLLLEVYVAPRGITNN